MNKILSIINEEIGIMLSEGLSDIVYHFAFYTSVINILKTNKINTSPNLGTTADAQKDRGRFFYFSTQRSKGKSGYGRNHGDTVLVMDGRKLMQKYKGFPTDYWNWSKKRSDYETEDSYRQALQSTEMEDRIVTDEPYIENAKEYILEIHAKVNNWYHREKSVMELQTLAQQAGIPLFLYTDDEAFKLQDKRKAVNLEDIDHEFNTDDESEPRESRDFYYTFKKIAPYILFDTQYESDIWKLFMEFLKSRGQQENFDEYKKEFAEKTMNVHNMHKKGYYKYWDRDVKSILIDVSNEIHNNKSSTDPYFRELLRLLIRDMKDFGATNLKDYFIKKLGIEHDD